MISLGKCFVEVETVVDKKYGGFSMKQVELLEVHEFDNGTYGVVVEGEWATAEPLSHDRGYTCKVYEKEDNNEECGT